MHFLVAILFSLISSLAYAHTTELTGQEKAEVAIEKRHNCYHLSFRLNATIQLIEQLYSGTTEDIKVVNQYLNSAEQLSTIYKNYCR